MDDNGNNRELEIEQFIEQFEETYEKWCKFWEEIYQELQEIARLLYEAIRKWVEKLIRDVFLIRLVALGIPVLPARLIARYCPWRWLPVRWTFHL